MPLIRQENIARSKNLKDSKFSANPWPTPSILLKLKFRILRETGGNI